MSWRRARVEGATTLLIAICVVGVAAGNQRPRAAWTHYVNARWGFCVDYPAAWKADEQSDGSGVTLSPKSTAQSKNGPFVSITGVPDQPDIGNANIVLDDSPPPDLEGNLARVLGNLRAYDHASDIRVLEKRKLTFQGFDALSTKYQYRSGRDGSLWLSDTLWINKEYIIITASLLGRPEEVRDLEPVYQDIVKHRFRLECGGKQPRPAK